MCLGKGHIPDTSNLLKPLLDRQLSSVNIHWQRGCAYCLANSKFPTLLLNVWLPLQVVNQPGLVSLG